MSIELSTLQRQAYDAIMDSILNKQQTGFVLSGVAGSGKTALIHKISDDFDERKLPVYCLTLTGRAASVLRARGVVNAQTIHSFLYEPIINKDNVLIGWRKKDYQVLQSMASLIFVDEASMVSEDIFEDLLNTGIPLVFVGDSEQLPPISHTGFNIMDSSDFHLDEIHRQAEGNPIIEISRSLREENKIDRRWVDGDRVSIVKKTQINRDMINKISPDIIMCGTHKKRKAMNSLVRAAREFSGSTPEIGERVMCLKNGGTYSGDGMVYNGEIYVVDDFGPYNPDTGGRVYKIHPYGSETAFNTRVLIEDDSFMFNEPPENVDAQYFTHGYAATVHKLQGSEFDHAMFYDEYVGYFLDQRRFRYTAVTRARERLTIVM